KKAGLETECYFMLGHPGETVEDIEASIKLALELAPHYCKFAITIPLPGTALFDSMEANGQIKSRDWEKYTFATSPRQLYDHDTLSWEEIERYYDASHRRFYLRPSYMARMVGHSLANGTFWGHVKAFLGTRW
ncbi:MAG: hypothetical protein HY794_18695, partial [Desulfarculus sp.]|nr:hypothetical protein [Desulfarculus sp.]